jgi:hypothetical protein
MSTTVARRRPPASVKSSSCVNGYGRCLNPVANAFASAVSESGNNASTRKRRTRSLDPFSSLMGITGLKRPPHMVNDRRAARRNASKSPCSTHQPSRKGLYRNLIASVLICGPPCTRLPQKTVWASGARVPKGSIRFRIEMVRRGRPTDQEHSAAGLLARAVRISLGAGTARGRGAHRAADARHRLGVRR